MAKEMIIVTSRPLTRDDGGVSISIINTIQALKKENVRVSFILDKNYDGVMNTKNILEINKNYKAISSSKVLLCIDFDGFNIKGIRSGGKNIKIVHIRTNFLDIIKYENKENFEYCKLLGSLELENTQTADGIIFSSKYTWECFKKFIDSKIPIRIINNGVDDELINKLHLFEGIKYIPGLILSFGNFFRRKSFDTLIVASKILQDQGINHKLIIFGDGPEKKKLIELANGNENIKIKPFIKSVEYLAKCYKKASIICHPALQEDFGNVYIEAGEAKKTIVAADCGPARELIINDETGLFFEPANGTDLAFKLRILLNNRQLCERMGIKGSLHAQHYRWGKAAYEIRDFISFLYNQYYNHV